PSDLSGIQEVALSADPTSDRAWISGTDQGTFQALSRVTRSSGSVDVDAAPLRPLEQCRAPPRNRFREVVVTISPDQHLAVASPPPRCAPLPDVFEDLA